MAPAVPDRWRSDALRSNFEQCILESTHTLLSFSRCERHVSSAKGDEWFWDSLWWLRPPAETPSPCLSLSHISLFKHTHLHNLYIHPGFTDETVWLSETQEPFLSFVEDVMAKRRSVYPSSPAAVLLRLSLAPTHTQREKITVLAKQERHKKGPVYRLYGWEYMRPSLLRLFNV